MMSISGPDIDRHTEIVVLYDVHSECEAEQWVDRLIDSGADEREIAHGFLSVFARDLAAAQNGHECEPSATPRAYVVISSIEGDHDNLYIVGGVLARLAEGKLYFVTQNTAMLRSQMLLDLMRPKERLGELIAEVAGLIGPTYLCGR